MPRAQPSHTGANETPAQITVSGPDGYLAALSRIVFQSRMGRAVVDANASVLDDLEPDPGFAAWLSSHPDEIERDAALIRQFKYLGPTSVAEFCMIVGEPTAQHGPT